jgi:hypothetical protein
MAARLAGRLAARLADRLAACTHAPCGRLARGLIAWRYWLAWPVAVCYGGGGVVAKTKSYRCPQPSEKKKTGFLAPRLYGSEKSNVTT